MIGGTRTTRMIIHKVVVVVQNVVVVCFFNRTLFFETIEVFVQILIQRE
jgi:hypothetical protein